MLGIALQPRVAQAQAQASAAMRLRLRASVNAWPKQLALLHSLARLSLRHPHHRSRKQPARLCAWTGLRFPLRSCDDDGRRGDHVDANAPRHRSPKPRHAALALARCTHFRRRLGQPARAAQPVTPRASGARAWAAPEFAACAVALAADSGGAVRRGHSRSADAARGAVAACCRHHADVRDRAVHASRRVGHRDCHRALVVHCRARACHAMLLELARQASFPAPQACGTSSSCARTIRARQERALSLPAQVLHVPARGCWERCR